MELHCFLVITVTHYKTNLKHTVKMLLDQGYCLTRTYLYRSSHSEVFLWRVVLKICSKKWSQRTLNTSISDSSSIQSLLLSFISATLKQLFLPAINNRIRSGYCIPSDIWTSQILNNHVITTFALRLTLMTDLRLFNHLICPLDQVHHVS